MVVVVMVAILATIAVPQITERMRERRSAEAAQRIASLYRGARMRALGRGAAVLVRYGSSGLTVREAVQGTAASGGCDALPSPNCLTTDWNTTTGYHDVATFDFAHRSEYEDVQATFTDSNGNAHATLDVCYTPVGRTYVRNGTTGTMAALTGVVTVAVSRGSGSLERRVSVLPSGIARLAL